MILHLFDDEKVVNRAINLFEEAFPGQNIFIVRVIEQPKSVQVDSRIILYREGDVLDEKMFIDIDNITIHSLQLWKIDLIYSLGIKPAKIWWCVWGADMYNSILAYLGYKMYYEPRFSVGYLKIQILSMLAKLGVYSSITKKQLIFIKNYVTNLKTSREEYEIQKYYIGSYLTAKFCEVPMNLYYSIDDILSKGLIEANVKGNKILVGNSASYSNNHLYAYKFLKNLKLGDRQIVSPLSYGGDDKYKEHIIAKANMIFKDRFIPLLNFLPLEEYNQLLLQSEICVYGNWRQEAMGNILVSIYLGAKVFLSKKSPLIKRFYRMGIKVCCLEDITQCELETPLTMAEKAKNREILYGLLNRNAIIDGIRKSWKS